MRTQPRAWGREKLIAISVFGTMLVAISGAATGAIIGEAGMVYRSGHAYTLPASHLAATRERDTRPSYLVGNMTVGDEVVRRGQYRYLRDAQDTTYSWEEVEYIPVDGVSSAPEYRLSQASSVVETRAYEAPETQRMVAVSRGHQTSVATIPTRSASTPEKQPPEPLFPVDMPANAAAASQVSDATAIASNLPTTAPVGGI